MYFGDITIQSKDDIEDFRAYAHVRDSDGDWWELRGYGRTAGEAAQNAWDRYKKGEDHWDEYGYGYTTDPPEEKIG